MQSRLVCTHHMLPTQRTTSGSWAFVCALRFTRIASRMRVLRSVRMKWCSDAYMYCTFVCLNPAANSRHAGTVVLKFSPTLTAQMRPSFSTCDGAIAALSQG